MERINCVIIDDNIIERSVIEDYVGQACDLRIVGSFSNPLESLSVIKSVKIQLLFMDIDMPVMNGIDFFKTLASPPLCIFITNYQDFAIEAFDVHACDYLMKPVKKKRFEESLTRVKATLAIQAKALQYEKQLENDVLTIKEGTSINKVQLHDIIYLEALTNYTQVVTSNKKYTTLQNLKNFLEELPQGKFLRIHRSYAVAVNRIARLESGELSLGQYKLPVGKTYRQNIQKLLA